MQQKYKPFRIRISHVKGAENNVFEYRVTLSYNIRMIIHLWWIGMDPFQDVKSIQEKDALKNLNETIF